MKRKRITLNLTAQEEITLGETVEIAVEEAQVALQQHETLDSPNPKDDTERQIDAYQQQIELVEMQHQRIADLDEIQRQLKGGQHDGT